MIYFDHAATSYPKPRAVLRAMREALTAFGGNPGRGGHRLSLAAAEMVFECRNEIAELFGIREPERVVFTAGATMALNLAIRISVRKGMHVLISDREHNAVLRPLLRLAEEGVVTYDVYPTAGDTVASIEERITPSTGLVLACHVSNVSGFTLPLDRISSLCQRRGLRLIVDAAQSAGHLPIDLGAAPCTALCAPAHKGLLGAAGCGFVILDGTERLPPFLAGGSGVDSLSPEMPRELPERYEAGTLPTPAIAALLAGVRYVKERGIPTIAAEEATLKASLLEGLADLRGIRLYEPECGGGLVAFTHERKSPEEIARLLDRHGICVRAGYHCAPLAHRTLGTPTGGCVRVALGHGNRPAEVEHFLKVLPRILSEP